MKDLEEETRSTQNSKGRPSSYGSSEEVSLWKKFRRWFNPWFREKINQGEGFLQAQVDEKQSMANKAAAEANKLNAEANILNAGVDIEKERLSAEVEKLRAETERINAEAMYTKVQTLKELVDAGIFPSLTNLEEADELCKELENGIKELRIVYNGDIGIERANLPPIEFDEELVDD